MTMTKLVRVQLANGSETTVTEGFAKSHDLKVLDVPAVAGGVALNESHENTKKASKSKEENK